MGQYFKGYEKAIKIYKGNIFIVGDPYLKIFNEADY